MQDIISTLKNALQQAEAGLEVAVGRLAKDGTERGEFQPSEVLALSCVRGALAMPVPCLHQIQEPAAAEQAAWHAGLDEGRAQAAPAAVAVPDGWKLVPTEPTPQMCHVGRYGGDKDAPAYGEKPVEGETAWPFVADHTAKQIYCAMLAAAPALAATPAAAQFVDQISANLIDKARSPETVIDKAAAPVVLPEPWGHLVEGRIFIGRLLPQHVNSMVKSEGFQPIKLFTEQQLRALLATATELPAQADTPDSFREWFAKNYPADTIIVDPDWHAKSIFRMAQAHARLAAPQAQADARDAERWRAAREGVKSGDRVIHVNTVQHGLGTKLLGSAADAEIDAAIAAAKGE